MKKPLVKFSFTIYLAHHISSLPMKGIGSFDFINSVNQIKFTHKYFSIF